MIRKTRWSSSTPSPSLANIIAWIFHHRQEDRRLCLLTVSRVDQGQNSQSTAFRKPSTSQGEGSHDDSAHCTAGKSQRRQFGQKRNAAMRIEIWDRLGDTPQFVVAELCLKVATDQDVLQSWPSIDDQVPRRAVLRRVFSRGRGGGRGSSVKGGVEPFSIWAWNNRGKRGRGEQAISRKPDALQNWKRHIFAPCVDSKSRREVCVLHTKCKADRVWTRPRQEISLLRKLLCSCPRQHQRTNRRLAADPFHSIFAIVCNGRDLWDKVERWWWVCFDIPNIWGWGCLWRYIDRHVESPGSKWRLWFGVLKTALFGANCQIRT